MSDARTVRIRRSVVAEVTVEGERVALTINDMDHDPERAVLGVTTDSGGTLVPVQVGSEVAIGRSSWTVESLVVGDRGSVALTRASD